MAANACALISISQKQACDKNRKHYSLPPKKERKHKNLYNLAQVGKHEQINIAEIKFEIKKLRPIL